MKALTLSEEESSVDTETTYNESSDIEDNNNYKEMTEINKFNEEIKEYRELIEGLKHEKLILEEWKNEIGLVAVRTVEKLRSEIEITQNTLQQNEIEVEGLQTMNNALKQQITAYQDEIDKLREERPKMEQQISHFAQLLNGQYLKQQELRSKDEELITIKREYESIQISLENGHLELRTLRKENAEIKRENEQFCKMLDSLKENEEKLKKEMNAKQNALNELNIKYDELQNKLQQETVSQFEQLQVATDIANNLSIKLEEIENFKNYKKATKQSTNSSETEDEGEDNMSFGRPLFEKRKTLKIINYESTSCKLPNMSELIDSCSNHHDDEEEHDELNNLEFKNKINSKCLPPVNEFDDDLEDDQNTKIVEYKEYHQRDRKLSSSMSAASTISFDDEYSLNMNEANQSEQLQINQSSKMYDEEIEKLLRKINGSSYHKFRNGTSCKMDTEQRGKIKMQIIAYIDNIRNELKHQYQDNLKEKELLNSKYKRDCKHWQEKYKALKTEIKKRKLRQIQLKQKSTDPNIAGCKFWSWGFQQNWLSNAIIPNIANSDEDKKAQNIHHKKVHFFVADDSESLSNESNIYKM